MSNPGKPSATVRAHAAWGDTGPDWIKALAAECDRTSQAATAKRIGKSGSLVCQVLANAYPADLRGVEQMVRDVLMAGTVRCPVMGDLASTACLAHQGTPWAPNNPQRITLYRACRDGCPNSRLGGPHDR